MRPDTRVYLAVGLGAAIGSGARAAVSLGLHQALAADFAWGTLTVNVLGSFLIGLYAALTGPDGRLMAGPATRQFVLAGFCGGFTTFSIFSLETLLFVAERRIAVAALYVGVSVVLWLVAVWLGHRLGTRLNRLKAVAP